MVTREERKRERATIRRANLRGGRPPTTRNNRVLIRDNRRVISENTQSIQDVYTQSNQLVNTAVEQADRRIGGRAFELFRQTGEDQQTRYNDDSEYLDRTRFGERLGFGANTQGANREQAETSTFISNLSEELYQVDRRAQDTNENVETVTAKSSQALNNTLLIASASISALGGALDSANQVLLQSVFLGIQTVRALATAINTSTVGAGTIFTAVVGSIAVSTLLIQSYQIRQNRQNTANQLGQAGASLQALAVIGSAF